MALKLRKTFVAAAGALLGGLSLDASAQFAPPTVTYGPAGNAVPAMGGAALVVLAVLLAAVGMWLLNKRSHKLASVAMLLGGASVVLVAALGAKSVQAIIAEVVVVLSAPGGGQVELFPVANPTTWLLPNTSGVPQKILEIDPGVCSDQPIVAPVSAPGVTPDLVPLGTNRGDCLVGMTLQPDEYCSLLLYCPVT